MLFDLSGITSDNTYTIYSRYMPINELTYSTVQKPNAGLYFSSFKSFEEYDISSID